METHTRLEHVAVAVADLESAATLYSALLGRPESGRETVVSEGVRVAFFQLDDMRLELMEATAPDTPVGRFLEKRGPGLHHIAVEVDDVEAALERCRAAGAETVGPAPRTGAGGRRVAFLNPKGTAGVLIELTENPARP